MLVLIWCFGYFSHLDGVNVERLEIFLILSTCPWKLQKENVFLGISSLPFMDLFNKLSKHFAS